MRVKELLLGLLLLLASASALDKSDYLKLVENTGQCLTDCHTIYYACNPTLSQVDTSGFKIAFTKAVDYELLTNYSGKWSKVNLESKWSAQTCYYLKIEGKKQPLDNIDNIPSWGGYDFPEFAWWNSSFLQVIQFALWDSLGNTRNYEDVTLNASGLTLATNNCTEIRLTGVYSDGQREIPREIANDSGQALGDGNEWCLIRFTANFTATTTANTTHLAINTTNLMVYANNLLSADANGLSIEPTKGWLNESNARLMPEDVATYPFTRTASGTTSQSFINTSNVSYWNFTISSASNLNFSRFPYAQTWEARIAASSGFIMHSNDSLATGGCVVLRFNSTGYELDGECNGTIEPVYYGVLTDSTTFHTYRGATQPDGRYSLFVDNQRVFYDYITKSSPGANSGILAFGLNSTGTMLFDYFAYKRDTPSTFPLQLINQTGASLVSLYCKDFETPATIIPCNVTIANSTASQLFNPNVSSNTTATPTGVVLISLINESYEPVYVSATLNASQGINSSRPLLLKTSASTINFHIQTTALTPISGATVYARYLLDGIYTIVANSTSDSSGTASLKLSQLYTYYIEVEASGYTGLNSSIKPSGTDYTLTLSTGNVSLPSFLFDDVTYSLSPSLLSMNKSLTPVWFTVTAINNNLTLFGLNVSYAGTWIFNQTSTSSSGGNINITLNNTLRSGNITIVLFIKKTGFNLWTQNYTYHIYNISSTEEYTSADALRDLANNLKFSPDFGAPLILLIIVGFTSAWMARFSIIGGGLLALILLGAAMAINPAWFPPWAWFVMAIGLFALVIIRFKEGG